MRSFNKIFFFVLLVTCANIAMADTQDRHLSGFHAIGVSGSFDVYITQGSTESVRVEAPSNVIDHIVTELKGDVLEIHDKNEHFDWGNIFSGHRKIVVYVSVKDIRAIKLSGSGDVYFKDGISTNRMELTVSGSGDVQGKLNVKVLVTGVTGSGGVKLSGNAETSTVSVSGSGDFSARQLLTSTTMVRVTGSGDASVNASQKVDAHVSGSGDIHYTGGAKQVSSSTSGSGEIHRG